MSELIQPEELYDRLRIAAFRNRETVTDILHNRQSSLYGVLYSSQRRKGPSR